MFEELFEFSLLVLSLSGDAYLSLYPYMHPEGGGFMYLLVKLHAALYLVCFLT